MGKPARDQAASGGLARPLPLRGPLRALLCAAFLALCAAGPAGCFWLWPLTQPTETLYATTPDNWRLALHRYRPENISVEKEPLLLVHDIASNRFNFDLARDRSLPLYLYEKGYDVWMLELRNAGESDKAVLFNLGSRKADYTFDTFVDVDVPTAIEFIRYETRKEQISWIGHSLGAMLGYAYLGQHPGEKTVRNFVALSGPASFRLRAQAVMFLLQFKGVADQFVIKPQALRLAAQGLANWVGTTDLRFDNILWNGETTDARTMSMFVYNGVSNLSGPLFDQVTGWVESGEFTSADRQTPYGANLDRIRIPTLVITGKLDALCPPAAAREVFQKIGTLDKGYRVIGTANGFTGDYGHLDVVIGNRAREDVFPLVYGWLEQH